MPRRRDHVVIAFIILVPIWLIFGVKYFNMAFLINWLLFLFGSLAPDFLEPAHYFTHRNFFHSQKLLEVLSIFTAAGVILWLVFRFQLLLFVVSFSVGYIIHLLLDSTTKMGLPKDSNSMDFKKIN